MKAVIMAGGEGKRLRAVSGDKPKPLVPFLGRSMIEHIILLLKQHGFEDICITLRYKAEMIIAALGDGSRYGVKLQYRLENEPCGTAGGVKNCEDFYINEDFLVISGDAACDLDLTELWTMHKQRRAAASIALCKNAEPLRYGLAVTDRDERIRAFIEKPDWHHVVTDTVNTGIYILSPAAMELVPRGRFFDFAKDLFPELLRRDMLIVGRELPGYWCDVGTPLSYYRCCADALEGRLKLAVSADFIVPDSGGETQTESGESFPCKNRAALMAALTNALMELDPDLTDGLSLTTPRCKLHVCPSAVSSALRILTSSQDSEFAKEFTATTMELLNALENDA